MLRKVKSRLPAAEYKENQEEITKSLSLREVNGEILMQSTEILGLLKPKEDLDINKIPGLKSVSKKSEEKSDFIPLSNIEVTLQAKWYLSSEKKSDGTPQANIFHVNNGTFELIDSVEPLIIPTVDVTRISPEDLKSYNVTVLNEKNPIIKKYNTLDDKNLYFITYDYSKDHLSKYTMQPEFGGGFFVEHHDHPHVFKPVHSECHGSTIIGKLVSEDKQSKIGTYKFISIRINYPNAVAIPANVIHGNAAFVGPYTISTNPSTKASIAIVHKPNGDLQQVIQPELAHCSSSLMKFSLFENLKRERELARTSYLKSLVKNRHISPQHQEAYDKQYGLVPVKK